MGMVAAKCSQCGAPIEVDSGVPHVKTVTVLNDGHLDPIGDGLIHHRFM